MKILFQAIKYYSTCWSCSVINFTLQSFDAIEVEMVTCEKPREPNGPSPIQASGSRYFINVIYMTFVYLNWICLLINMNDFTHGSNSIFTERKNPLSHVCNAISWFLAVIPVMDTQSKCSREWRSMLIRYPWILFRQHSMPISK